MMEWLSERFAPGPGFAWLCVGFLAAVPLVWIMARVVRRPSVRFSSLSAVRWFGRSWAMRALFVIPLLRTLAIVVLVIALARPQMGGVYRDSAEGIAIQMVLDVSGSMEELDFKIGGRKVRRIDAVKNVFRDFVLGASGLAGRPDDLIAMTTFAMYADTPCPLTRDHGSLVDVLDQTEIPGWVNGKHRFQHAEASFTAMGDAITLATDDLRRAGKQAVSGMPGAEAAKSRVMILLTDGVNNPPGDVADSPDPIEAARLAATLGVKIYTIGAVGSSRRSNRLRRGFLFQRRQAVDERALREIADITGGKYFRATDTESLVTIYDEIDKLERRATGERTYRDNIRGARTAMIVALALVMTELLLVNTRFRRIP